MLSLGAKRRFNRSTYEVVSACQNEVTDDDKDGHKIHFGQGGEIPIFIEDVGRVVPRNAAKRKWYSIIKRRSVKAFRFGDL